MGVLDGKVIVVTGGSRGFGLAMARAFGRAGAKVVLASRSAGSVEDAVGMLQAEGVQCSGLACDVSSLEQVQALADHALREFGRLDVWVNNAGISPAYGPTIHVPVDEFVATTQTNVLGAYYGSLTAMRHFLKEGRGKLINILGRGERGPQPMQNAYASSKAWLKSFTLALAEEYKDSGVGVYAFSPGMMDTELLTNVEVIQGFEHRLKSFGAVVQALSTPPEVPAERAVWLASSATDGKTGLVVREMSGSKVMKGFLRMGADRLLRRPGRDVEVRVKTVPAAYPVDGKKK